MILTYTKRTTRVLVTIASLAALNARPAHAQVVDQPVAPPQSQPALPGINSDSFYGKEPTEGVYVRDSAGAVEKLALAEKMEKLKEWNKSADLYQEVIVKYADRMVPSQLDKDKKIYQYTSINNPVQEKMAHWPAEGLEVYKARFETPAQAMLDTAGPNDAATLNKVYSLYFVTEAGKQAGIRLMDLYLENGEYPAAAWLGDRLLTLHPGLEAERSAVLYRTALAYYYAGDPAKAKERLDTLKTRFPNDRGTVRGKDVVLADSLATEIIAPVASSQSASPDSWPTPFGDPSRGRISTAEGRPGARLYGIPLSKPNWPSNSQQKESLQKQYEAMIDQGETLGVMPVTDRGELFFQDGQCIYGVSIESGVALPGWSQSYPNGAYTLAGVSCSPRAQQLSVTLTDHEVLGIMGFPDQQAALVNIPATGEAKLVCLDRQSGREKWTATLSQLPDQAKEARTLSMTGSPLVVGDSVLIIAHGAKTQFEDCYVLAFDLSTGKFRWSTYIASASAGAMVWNGMAAVARTGDNSSLMAYANGRVYVQTNLGALAALDAYTGAVVWLDIYPTGRQLNERAAFNPFMQQNQPQAPAHKPWTFNPVMVVDGYVFTLPTEGDHLLIYDAATGVEIKRIDIKEVENKCNSTTTPRYSGLDTLVGVIHDDLLLCGEEGMIDLNWRQYSSDAFDPNLPGPGDHITKWLASFGSKVRGRPFIVNGLVYVPIGKHLCQLQLRNGKDVLDYPARDAGETWEAPEEPGNVIATSDYVVVAGAKMVNVYTDLTLAKAKLDKELALSPTDPQIRLKYAEIMFAAGDIDAVTAKMDEAIGLMGGLSALASGVNRDRLFSDALNDADKLAKSTREEDRTRAIGFYDRAGASAFSPVQQVHYRLSRAKFAEAGKDYAAAVAFYQQILSDPQLRPVPMSSDAAGTTLQADGLAEKEIADIMKDHPGAYESFQQAAAAAMADAQASKDDPAGKLLEIARAYPNSTVAGQAMIAAARSFEAAGDFRHSIRVLRDLWFKHSEGPDKVRIQEAIARNYLLMAALPRESAGDHGPMDNMEAAAAALARAASFPGDATLEKALKLRDGTVIDAGTPIAHALDVVRKMRGEEVSKALPDLHVPIPRHVKPWPEPFLPVDPARDVLANIKSLLVPDRDFARADRVVAYTTDGVLDFLASGEMKPLASVHGLGEEPKSCAWVGKSLLVWGGPSVASINSESGEIAWKINLRQMQPIEVVRIGDNAQTVPDPGMPDPVLVNGGARIRIINGQRVVFRPGMRAVVAPQPVIAPNRPVVVGGPEEIVDVRPVGDHLLITTTSGRILSAELSNGKVAWQTRLSDRPVDRLVANEDFAVVRASDDNAVRLAAFDTATGQLRCTRSWVVQSGMVPINLALAADGTLVYTLPDRLCLKDLYKPWPDASDKEVQANQGGQGVQIFERATQPDQLLIAEGRILALANNGSVRYVRVHSLETGQPVPLRYHGADGEKSVDRILTAGKSDEISLRVVGSHLYVVSPYVVYNYNLDRPSESWQAPYTAQPEDGDPQPSIRDVFVDKKFAVLLHVPVAAALPPVAAPVPVPGGVNVNPPNGEPAPAPDGAPATEKEYGLEFIGRYPASAKNPAETGRRDYMKSISDPAGILPQWQASDGGFYYLTADSKLHMLRGSEAGK